MQTRKATASSIFERTVGLAFDYIFLSNCCCSYAGDPALYECAKAPEAVLKAVQDATKVDFNRTYQVHEGEQTLQELPEVFVINFAEILVNL